MTRVIVEVAKPLGIAVHDHIVGKEGHASFSGRLGSREKWQKAERSVLPPIVL